MYTNRFRKSFRNVPDWVKRRVLEIIEELKVNPYIGKRLRGPLSKFWSIRIGDYRLIYEIDEQERTVILHEIGHRGRVYERLGALLLFLFFLNFFK